VAGREAYRASVVVSRKVSKSAVVRNRIRRRIYEQIRLHQSQFVPGLDMAIVVYDASFATTPAPVLAKDFHNLLKKAAILRADHETRGIVDKKL
jgi:ribonuclease P protein component